MSTRAGPPAHASALPWEPQPGESAKAYAAFRSYAALPPQERSIDHAWESYADVTLAPGHRCPGHFNRWARENTWSRRAAAWDAERARQLRDAELQAEREQVAEMRRRHIAVAMSLQAIAAEDLQRMRSRQTVTRGDAAPPTLTPYQVARILRDGVAIERLARGEPETITEEREAPADPAANSDDETRALILRILSDPEALDLAQHLALALDSASGPAPVA